MTDEMVISALRNMGIDTECGACMEVAFTGVTTNQHTCAASPPAADIGLEELEQEVRAAAKYAPRRSTGAKYLEWADRLAAIAKTLPRVSGQLLVTRGSDESTREHGEIETALAAVRGERRAGDLCCMDCGAVYSDFPLDTTLPNEQWRMIHDSDGGILCASCIVRRAAKLPHVVAVRAVIEFAAARGEKQA